MSRLPIIGGDYDAWGTVLNDYLTKAADVTALAASTSAGATQFDLAVIPPSLKVGSVVAVDAYTAQCELKGVTNISGNTVTVSTGTRLMFAHDAGDHVVVINDSTVHSSLFGLVGDGSDQWQPLQRWLLESRYMSCTAVGGGAIFYFQQPIFIDTNSYWERINLRTRTGFAPVQATYGAAIQVGNGSFWFKATGSDNTFTSTVSDHTTAVNHGLSLNQTIVFNAPYGETLPGNLVAGKVYFVKTVPTGSTFTISETLGGAEFDISSDGTGWSMNNPGDGLARVFWESVYLTLTIVDLNGMRMALQQPSWIRNLRLDMTATATTQGSAVGLYVTGQQSYLDNLEIGPWSNCTGMWLTGSGHIIKGFNSVGKNSAGDTGLVLQGDSLGVYGVWCESHGRAGIEIGDMCRGLLIEGPYLFAPELPGIPAILVTSTQNSFQLGIIRHTSGSGTFVQDTSARSYSIIIAGDIFNGMTQNFGNVPPVPKIPTDVSVPAYTPTNVTTDRSYDADTVLVAELADVVGTLIADLQARRIIG